MTYDNHPEVRRLYSWANVLMNPVSYSIGGQSKKTELLISNRDLLRITDTTDGCTPLNVEGIDPGSDLLP